MWLFSERERSLAIQLCVGTYDWAQKAHVEGLIASGWSLLYSSEIPRCVANHVYIAGEPSFMIYVCIRQAVNV
jgi:hypothetical protein